MKSSTQKRLEKKWNNLPRYFVDSSVFIELALKQERHKACMKFFNLIGFKHRIETSIIVLGEIVRKFDKVQDELYREELFRWLERMLREKEVAIHRPSRICFSLGGEISSFDSYLCSVDALVFETCVEASCPNFITLDSDFSESLGRRYSVKIHKL